jgi:hypothetical protein
MASRPKPPSAVITQRINAAHFIRYSSSVDLFRYHGFAGTAILGGVAVGQYACSVDKDE